MSDEALFAGMNNIKNINSILYVSWLWQNIEGLLYYQQMK